MMILKPVKLLNMYNNGVYVVSFSYPVVPKNLSKIRVQVSSSHAKEQMDKTIELLKQVEI